MGLLNRLIGAEMGFAVGGELGGLAEEASASRHPTVERFLTCVNEPMFLHILLACKAFSTDLA
jgi:hypothetical protein